MSETPEERKQWHPVLVDGLRYLMSVLLRIEPEHALALLPTRVDALVVRRNAGDDLAFPYSHLGVTTLVELVGPGDWATWRNVWKLCIDGLLYQSAEEHRRPPEATLWLVSSRLSRTFLRFLRGVLGSVEQVDRGVWRASHMGSPLFLLNLHELPLSIEALPLLMVYRGSREAEIAEFVLEQAESYPLFMEQLQTFHAKAMREVLVVKGINVEAYRKLGNVKDFVDLWGKRILIEEMGEEDVIREIGEEKFIREIGEEKIIRGIGEEKIIREIGEERIIREIGEEKLLDDLYGRMGPDRLREFLERKEQETKGNGKADPAT